MMEIQDELLRDMEAVRQIPIVPTMLETICQLTGMGFAAVARVTEDRWLACSVRDEVEFGLPEGGELKIETTLCNDVRDSRKPIVIDHVDEDPQFRNHHTPEIYGLQSYISFPIFLKNGEFFGTLCAIDSKPAKVRDPKIMSTFTMFAELLSFHLQSLDILERSHHATIELQSKNKVLTQVNNDLDNFVYTASHDLKSPVNNIDGLLNALTVTISKEPLDKAKANHIIGLMQASLVRLGVTMSELSSIVEADKNSETENTEAINVLGIIENVKQDLDQQIVASKAKIEVICEPDFPFHYSKKNFRSITYNLLSNAIKYCSPERCPEIFMKLHQDEDKVILSVKDNGLGIPADKQDKLFTLFNRFHDHVEGSGIGLYLVKRMVENGDGQIKVDSKLNEGTTFTITF